MDVFLFDTLSRFVCNFCFSESEVGRSGCASPLTVQVHSQRGLELFFGHLGVDGGVVQVGVEHHQREGADIGRVRIDEGS